MLKQPQKIKLGLQTRYWFRSVLTAERLAAINAIRRKSSLFDNLSYQSIFIHVPKTGGTSISKVLFDDFRKTHAHYKIADYYAEDEQRSVSMHKVCVVRNPWSRFVSAYNHLSNLPDWVAHKTKIFGAHFVAPHNFEDFVRFVDSNRWMMEWIHFKPQYRFLQYKGEICMDDILHFETLKTDTHRMFQRESISAELPHLNASRAAKTNYVEYYSDITRDIVGQLYAKDIELLNYKFDHQNSE